MSIRLLCRWNSADPISRPHPHPLQVLAQNVLTVSMLNSLSAETSRSPAAHPTVRTAPAIRVGNTIRGASTLWLGTALLCLLFVPLCLFYVELRLDGETIASALRRAQQERLYWPSDDEMAALESEAARASATEQQVTSALQQVQDARASWSSALQMILSAPSVGIRLGSLAWKADALLLQGTADTQAHLDAYVQYVTGSTSPAQVQVTSDGRAFSITLRERWRAP